MPLFDLRNANAAYKVVPVLNGISLSIEAVERVALVGCSGAGKPILLRV